LKIKNNAGHSVFEKLKNYARKEKLDLNYVLKRYSNERFLHRLSISKYSDDFALKGAGLFYVWTGENARMTKDIDLLGNIVPDLNKIRVIIKEICDKTDISDGIVFDTDKISVEEIRENQIYGGVRVLISSFIHSAVTNMQIDIGFGDSVYPPFENVTYPVILNMEKPQLKAYSRYTSIAEKFEAMVQLDMSNSRMKDFFDIWYLSKLFDYKISELSKAIYETFKRRGTMIPTSLPTCFRDEFVLNDQKIRQWISFIKKSEPTIEVPDFSIVAISVSEFILPAIKPSDLSLTWNKKCRDWKPA